MSNERPPPDDAATPRAAGTYEGPGYPTVEGRRSHLKRVALLATGAAAATTGLFALGRALVAPESCGTGDPGKGGVDASQSWLQSQLSGTPPPRPAGGMRPLPPPPEDDLRLAGEMVMPEHLPPEPEETTPKPCVLPATAPDDALRLKGDMVAPSHPPPPEDHPRLRGKVAMPQHHAPESSPPLPGAPPAVLPVPPAPEPIHLEVVEPAPPPPDAAKLREVYLTGASADGTPFTVMVLLDPGDQASFDAVRQQRRVILTALSPLVGTPDLAKERAAWKLVSKLVPGATIRNAGVVR